MPEILEVAPHAVDVPRKGEVNAWDNAQLVKTVHKTGKQHLTRHLVAMGELRRSHLARNVGSSNGAELATYVVEKGKPLITLVK